MERPIKPVDADALAAEIVAGIQNGDDVVALTGAGASADSGIAPFRAPGSVQWLWSGLGAVGVFLAGTGFAWQMWPSVAYFFYDRFFKRSVDRAEPNACHKVLSRVNANILTTNVDGLHLVSGSDHYKVAALHGTVYNEICNRCGSGNLPCCGRPRPAVLFFQDALRNDVVADAWARKDDLIATDPSKVTWVFVVGVSWAIPTLASPLYQLSQGNVRIVHVNPAPPPERFRTPGAVWVEKKAHEFFLLLEERMDSSASSRADG